ncbi:MAG TPA: hypothetical protein VER03_10050 [Bryobacteraceae bacterium]|nr:hypothetical protein [Bryobacteraceae bacterium]
MRTSIAIVHHANQYLITTGYDNREGIEAILGQHGGTSGFRYVLGLHERYNLPLNLHLSGTLIEAIAWHDPAFLGYVRDLTHSGLLELVGSSYGQNIMRFFDADYNRKQLDEELLLFETHLGVDAEQVKVFWPPERVWETKRMAPVLRDARLRNGGYRYVILDDRLLLAPGGDRSRYDESSDWDPELYRLHEIEGGIGLIAFPIATRLRRSIPPRSDSDWAQVQSELEGLLVHAAGAGEQPLLAMYADDMEKVAGIGEWGGEGPKHYCAFLEWLAKADWVDAVQLTQHANRCEISTRRSTELGTFQELAKEFDAGEGYERWYLAPDWAPYRGYFNWADSKVKEAQRQGGDATLIELAEKQLLAANWETAWHTPATGPHGDATQNGHASPWARALTSHSRHAGVTAEAAIWRTARDTSAHVSCLDIDNDGEREWVIKNQHLFAVISPRWGGRLVSLFSIAGDCGLMVVGNPCDDWNWMEELNRFMDVPRNHPGAFADVGFEHDAYDCEVVDDTPARVHLRLTNVQDGSAARGMVKEFELTDRACSLFVRYRMAPRMRSLTVECGLSPDYLTLLRKGSTGVRSVRTPRIRGWRSARIAAWLKPVAGFDWEAGEAPQFGHGYALRLQASADECAVALGVTPRRSVESKEESVDAAKPVTVWQ